MVTESNLAIVNMETLTELSDIFDGDLTEIVNDFLVSSSTQLASLKTAISISDFTAINAIAHEQKGASSNLGLDQFTNICEQLMQTAKNDDIEQCSQLSESLHSQLVSCKDALLKIINA